MRAIVWLVCLGLSFVLPPRAVRAADPNATCRPTGIVMASVTVKAREDLAGVKIVLDYPESAVSIPGFENRPEVQKRIVHVPAGFFMAPNDTDTKLIVSLAGTTALPAGRIFAVEFDHCAGNAVALGDFDCKVEQASDTRGKFVDGTTCSVELDLTRDRDARGVPVGQKKPNGNKDKRGGSP